MEQHKLKHHIYVFYGEEPYLIDCEVDKVLEKIPIQYDDFNKIRLKSFHYDIEEIRNIFETMPLLDPFKIVIIDNIDLSKANISAKKDFFEEFMQEINAMPDYLFLILKAQGSFFKGKFFKNIEKKSSIVNENKMSEKELKAFIEDYFKIYKKKIDKNSLSEYIYLVGYFDKQKNITLYDIMSDLEIFKNASETLITSDQIRMRFQNDVERNIFILLDHISSAKRTEAFKSYRDLLNGDTDPFHIFYLIVRQNRLLLALKLNRNIKYSDLGISQYELGKLKSKLNLWTIEKLFDNIRQAYAVEKFSKSTSVKIEELIEKYMLLILS